MEKKSDSKSRYEQGKYGDEDEDDTGAGSKSGEKYSEGKYSEMKGSGGGDEFLDDGKNEDVDFDIPQIDVTGIAIIPSTKSAIEDPLELLITFTLDRDVVAGYWEFKVSDSPPSQHSLSPPTHSLLSSSPPLVFCLDQFLVDSASSRIIKILGQSSVEDYPDGESEVSFKVTSALPLHPSCS